MQNGRAIIRSQRKPHLRVATEADCIYLSKRLRISHPAVSKWKVIPPFRAIQIAKLGDFSQEYIRPDINFNLA